MPRLTRLAVVGHRGDFGTCVPTQGLQDLEIAWVERPVEPDPERLRRSVEQLRPDAVIVLEPQAGEGELLAGSAPVIAAWLVANWGSGPSTTPLAGFDRVLAACPGAARRAAGHDVWRIQPPPVDDACFADVRPAGSPARVFFDGPTSAGRDALLQPTKHNFDLLHLAGGAGLQRLSELHQRSDIALDLAEEPGVTPRDRVGTALAAGLLVVAQRPFERPGLAAGTHVVTFGELWELHDLLVAIRMHPDAFRSMRVRGRRFAESLRASVVLPQLTRDLVNGA